MYRCLFIATITLGKKPYLICLDIVNFAVKYCGIFIQTDVTFLLPLISCQFYLNLPLVSWWSLTSHFCIGGIDRPRNDEPNHHRFQVILATYFYHTLNYVWVPRVNQRPLCCLCWKAEIDLDLNFSCKYSGFHVWWDFDPSIIHCRLIQ